MTRTKRSGRREDYRIVDLADNTLEILPNRTAKEAQRALHKYRKKKPGRFAKYAELRREDRR